MCGIIGYIGPRKATTDIILPGLSQIDERGYDSAGVVAVDDNTVVCEKAIEKKEGPSGIERVNPVETLMEREVLDETNAQIAIGHVRWATHGAISVPNAHPHTDCHERIWLVHNGIIENYQSLKRTLVNNGHNLVSETDTELIAHLIEEYLESKDGLETAVRKTTQRLEGTYGIAVIDRTQPDRIVAARQGSPLLIGKGEDEMFVASLEDAFIQYTKHVVEIPEGDVRTIYRDRYSGSQEPSIEINVEEDVTPDPFKHFMRKEIHEQPEVALATMNNGGRILLKEGTAKLGGIEKRQSELLGAKHLRLTACGTAYYACAFAAKMMRRFSGFETVEAVVASEANPEYFPDDTAVLAVSQSGETFDTLRVIREAKAQGKTVFSVINRVGKTIARETGCGIYNNAGREKAVASTKVFTSQCIALTLLSVWFGRHRETLQKSNGQAIVRGLLSLPDQIQNLIDMEDDIAAVADTLVDAQSMFYLGRGAGHVIAQEGALKMKEISYIHAEACAAGELKHGVLALVEDGFPVVAIILNDEEKTDMVSCLAEVNARGANLIAIAEEGVEIPEEYTSYVIRIPSSNRYTAPILANIPLQFLAYHTALKRGLNPDRPRNLAKSVTVG
jgi:glucosamine--fructose-6-phosphate aminotransferase (isomerizing)